jgi:hypothetical protein
VSVDAAVVVAGAEYSTGWTPSGESISNSSRDRTCPVMGASLHRDGLVQVVKQHVPFVNLPCMSTKEGVDVQERLTRHACLA